MILNDLARRARLSMIAVGGTRVPGTLPHAQPGSGSARWHRGGSVKRVCPLWGLTFRDSSTSAIVGHEQLSGSSPPAGLNAVSRAGNANCITGSALEVLFTGNNSGQDPITKSFYWPSTH